MSYQDPPHNGVECLECPGFANYFIGRSSCPNDSTHPTMPILISEWPLGTEHDEDCFVHGSDIWVYDTQLYGKKGEVNTFAIVSGALEQGLITQEQHDELISTLIDSIS